MRIDIEAATARHPATRPGARAALHGVSLHVEAGEHVAVIGPSGAGKTTLLHVAACALAPKAGTLRLDGVAPWTLPRRALQRLRSALFLAPQVPPLPPRQRVVTAVLAGRLPAESVVASLVSLLHPRDIAAAEDALEAFDIADKLFERVDRLSGGERQRVALARALVSPARLWLVDEPLSALDPTLAMQALRSVVDAARARAVTLVASLHQVELALAHFPRIVGLRDGALVFDLPAAEVGADRLAQLYAQHEHELQAAPSDAEVAPAATPAIMNCR